MRKIFIFAAMCVSIIVMAQELSFCNAESRTNAYVEWKNGPPGEPGYFPLAVWLQDPSDAENYKKAGINLYVGLWKGPTEKQLSILKSAGMQVICSQNKVGLKHIKDDVIVGWMHGDEPDNAQSLSNNQGYGPPILPEVIINDFKKIKGADPSRPVMLNLGQGVAWNKYVGRGVRSNHPEDYQEYVKGGDIVSFDIYPVASKRPEIHDNLWHVARGVKRLRTWTNNDKIVWNCIETTRINGDRRATPDEVKAEVWMSFIHGSTGIIYFVHEWVPEVNSHRLLNDPEMLEAVTAINKQIRELAPVLNSPTFHFWVEIKVIPADVPIAVMVKQYKGETYIFAVAMRHGSAVATFQLSGSADGQTVEVLGEGRDIDVRNGIFRDSFKPYDVHLYRVK